MSPPFLHADVTVIGAGIAGLWLTRLLSAHGFATLLLESDQIGAGQTIAAQGIIHGGTKYTLSQRLTGASKAIAAMPGLWNDALQGHSEVPLTATRILSESALMWANAPLSSKLTTFFAAKAMRSRITALRDEDIPAIVQAPDTGQTVYQLHEKILDVNSLLQDICAPIQQNIIAAQPDLVLENAPEDQTQRLRFRPRTLSNASQDWRIDTSAVIATAGLGNEQLLRSLGFQHALKTQRRPLHMVMVRGPLPGPLFGHCIEASANPRLTITSHEWHEPENRIWYLGGALAETGVQRSREQQIKHARAELVTLFPHLDMSRLQCDTFRIDRAEPNQEGGRRPDEPVVLRNGKRLLAWPTKLAFAPLLAQRVIEQIRKLNIQPSTIPFRRPEPLQAPPIASLPWKENRSWSPLDRSAPQD